MLRSCDLPEVIRSRTFRSRCKGPSSNSCATRGGLPRTPSRQHYDVRTSVAGAWNDGHTLTASGRMRRSQNALACGIDVGVFNTLTPCDCPRDPDRDGSGCGMYGQTVRDDTDSWLVNCSPAANHCGAFAGSPARVWRPDSARQERRCDGCSPIQCVA